MIDIYKYEKDLINKGYKYIAGTDEAGRGPMAGPLVAAAVILPNGYELKDLNDSKKLSESKREKLFDIIMRDALEVKVSFIDVLDVDRLNVYQASKIAMTNCIEDFKLPVDYVLSDAMPLDLKMECLPIIKGDMLSASIAAASIIAKVSRDRFMEQIDREYPMYGFSKHKGYVTKTHLENLNKFGPCKHHRKSFTPVKEVLDKYVNS